MLQVRLLNTSPPKRLTARCKLATRRIASACDSLGPAKEVLSSLKVVPIGMQNAVSYDAEHAAVSHASFNAVVGTKRHVLFTVLFRVSVRRFACRLQPANRHDFAKQWAVRPGEGQQCQGRNDPLTFDSLSLTYTANLVLSNRLQGVTALLVAARQQAAVPRHA